MMCHNLAVITLMNLVTKGTLNHTGISTSKLIDLYDVSSVFSHRHVLEVLADFRSNSNEFLNSGSKYLV